jgi:chitinase
MRRLVHGTLIVIVLLGLIFVLPASAADRGQWAPNTAYAVGDTATYGGIVYRCIQAHTSIVTWEPPNVPALWTPLGTPTSGGGGGATATRTRTPTRSNTPSGPTATRTRTPTRTNTSPGATATRTATSGGGGGACWAAWNASTAYNGGAQVSYNGVNYQAAYWTQNQRPDLNSGPAGSGQPWIPMGSCSGGGPTNTPVGPTATRTNTPGGPTATRTRTPTSGGGGGGGTRILGYFVEWGVYARNYHVKNIVTSGSAGKLTHINYAFGNVTGGQCVIGDAYADYDRFYSAAESVDGVADTWDAGALRGSFNQLRKLKQQYPNIRILWSFGGWTWSGGFGQAAANATAFANSCYNLVHDPRWNGVFDGIDIDWEYPNACGLSCDSSGAQAFVTLMSALRSRFGSELVTAAVPAGEANINAANYGGAVQYVDWYNVMSYDFFGAFDADGPTAPHSPLYSYTGIPVTNFNTDFAIQLYKSKGVPASKLLIGVGFYGRGWTGVSSANGGLNQPASGPAQGSYEPGIEDYKVLVNSCPSTGTVGGTAYAYCGGNWWSYDTPATLASKMSYKRSQGLGGAFFWELTGDTANGALITALYNNR